MRDHRTLPKRLKYVQRATWFTFQEHAPASKASGFGSEPSPPEHLSRFARRHQTPSQNRCVPIVLVEDVLKDTFVDPAFPLDAPGTLVMGLAHATRPRCAPAVAPSSAALKAHVQMYSCPHAHIGHKLGSCRTSQGTSQPAPVSCHPLLEVSVCPHLVQRCADHSRCSLSNSLLYARKAPFNCMTYRIVPVFIDGALNHFINHLRRIT